MFCSFNCVLLVVLVVCFGLVGLIVYFLWLFIINNGRFTPMLVGMGGGLGLVWW